MRAIIFLTFLLFSTVLFGQQNNIIVIDTVKNEAVIVGSCDREFLENFSPFNLYYADTYRDYNPNLPEPDSLLKLFDSISITVVFATWCSDSEEQIPKFFKLLDMGGFTTENVELIGVDGNKLAGEKDISSLNIEMVPTFIFYRNGIEIGRIIETPENSLEEDMLKIISN